MVGNTEAEHGENVAIISKGDSEIELARTQEEDDAEHHESSKLVSSATNSTMSEHELESGQSGGKKPKKTRTKESKKSKKGSHTALPVVDQDEHVELEVGDGDATATKDKVGLKGTLLVLAVIVFWVAQAECAAYVDKNGYTGAFLITWASMVCYTICLPTYLLCRKCGIVGSKSDDSDTGFMRDLIRSDGLTMGILFMATMYCYMLSLQFTAPGTAVLLFNTSPAFVYCLSLYILNDDFASLKVLAVCVTVSGVAVISFGDADPESASVGGKISWLGDIMAGFSSFGWSLFCVLFAKKFGDASGLFINGFFTSMGYFAILMTPVVIVFHYTKWEDMNSMPMKPMLALFVLTILLLAVVNYLWVYGVKITNPLFISVGGMLGIPISALLDVWLGLTKFNTLKIVGTLLVVAGFFLLELYHILDPYWQVLISCCKFRKARYDRF
eukprot:GFYU01026694.1.p1 GENE.GFYU01026694.1~~GFYU01026694.1.p1  ORF type:complete len:443 (+),score=66.93 GFYU01026694.1:147-1475(+)